MKINLERAKAGTLYDIGEEFYDAYKASGSVDGAASQVLADRIVGRYRGHIEAALRSKGIAIPEGQTLDSDLLLHIVNERTGLTIEAWTPDAVKTALDAYMAARLSAVLGVTVESVQDVETVRQSLIDAAAAAVDSGRVNAFVSRGMIKKMREAKAWKVGAVPVEDRAVTLSRWYQKKYRRSHKGVWRERG